MRLRLPNTDKKETEMPKFSFSKKGVCGESFNIGGYGIWGWYIWKMAAYFLRREFKSN
jgi:hypothetical protein